MASPHVAGVMALMRYVNPGLTVSQVDSLLAQGALTDDLGTAGRDSKFGFGLINARKAVDAALAVAGSPSPAPAGRVLASPSNIDFGSFQTTAALELVASAATAETVVSITSDNVAVTVAATAVDPITKLGRYTVNVNRALLGAGSNYPKLTVNLAPARSFTVQLTVTKTDDGSSRSGDFGPIYVLLIHPDAWVVVKTVLATRSGGKYTWSHSGYTLPRVLVVAGADLDNDAYICQRGEPCGAFPVIAQDVDLMSITLTGDRSDIDFQVAPLSGISSQGVGDNSTKGWRRGTLPPVPVVPPPAKSILGTTRSAQ